MKGFDGQPHAVKFNWENVSFYIYKVIFIIQIASARFENTIYNKKTAKKHYNRNIYISQEET